MPHTPRSVGQDDDETLAELGVLCGFNLAGQITATLNRIRGLLTQIHPTLERGAVTASGSGDDACVHTLSRPFALFLNQGQ